MINQAVILSFYSVAMHEMGIHLMKDYSLAIAMQQK